MEQTFSIIDSHCHLDRFHQRGELGSVLEDACAAGVDRLITVGTSDEDWALYAELAKMNPGVIDYTVGLHPCSVGEDWEKQVEQIEAYFSTGDPRPVALGEIGLDHFHLPKKDFEKAERIKQMQLDALRAQLKIALKFDCPVVIHSRGAFDECIRELDAVDVNWQKTVFHCFVEDKTAMKILNGRGGRGSFTGIITFKNANEVREAALSQGVGKLMVETDAPYLAPEPHRGKPCLPAYTALTAKYCAALFGVTEEELADLSRRNTETFFDLV